MALNLQDAFGLPLRAQALALFAVANGAVPLPAVEAIKRMAVFAMCFLGVHIAHGRRVAQRIFRSRDHVQVLRIHALAVAARVIHHVTVWDRPIRQPQREPMRLACCSAKQDDAVAVLVHASRPQDAVTSFRGFGVKPLQLLFSCDVHRRCVSVAMALTAAMIPHF